MSPIRTVLAFLKAYGSTTRIKTLKIEKVCSADLLQEIRDKVMMKLSRKQLKLASDEARDKIL